MCTASEAFYAPAISLGLIGLRNARQQGALRHERMHSGDKYFGDAMRKDGRDGNEDNVV